MKIHSVYVKSAISLIELAIDGLNRIKELILSHKEITDDDWMRTVVPLTELSNISKKQMVEAESPKCSQCKYFSKGILTCIHPANNYIKVMRPESTSCDYLTLESDETDF